jgi:hypothetical protein
MKIWIIGAGKFGTKAVAALNRNIPAARLTVIDHKSWDSKSIAHSKVDFVTDDGIKYLHDHLNRASDPDWIVPAIPIHVAYEWVRRTLEETHIFKPVEIPEAVFRMLPNPIDGTNGTVYVSNADFICPDDCMEPEGVCTYTGRSRPRALHEFLSELDFAGFKSVVVQSVQLSPGVGGFSPRGLYEALSHVRHSKAPVLMSTACKCHGVVNAFRLASKTVLGGLS